MRRNLVVGNWKMKINQQSAQKLVDGLIEGLPSEDADIAVCPPYLYIPLMHVIIHGHYRLKIFLPT
jgi:triosephosphate isomerase